MRESLGIDSLFMGAGMPKAYSRDLRERVITAVEIGASRREAAERFEVSVASAVKWLQRWYQQSSATPKPRGGSVSPLEEFSGEILDLIARQPDLTLVETVAELRKRRIKTSRSSLWRFLDRHNITLKKTYGAPRSQVVSAHDNLTSLRQRIRSRRYFPGQDGDPRVPVLINRFGVDDAIFLTRVPGRRSTVRPSRFPPPANIEGQSAHCAAGQSGLCRRRDGETERLAVPQHRPGQTRQFVGQRDHDGVFVHSRHQAAQPCPQRGRTLKQCGQGRSGTMDQKLAEIFI